MASFNKVSDVWSDDLLRSISVTEEQIAAAVCVRETARKAGEDHVTDLEFGRPYNVWKDSPDMARQVNEFLAQEPKSRK